MNKLSFVGLSGCLIFYLFAHLLGSINDVKNNIRQREIAGRVSYDPLGVGGRQTDLLIPRDQFLVRRIY